MEKPKLVVIGTGGTIAASATATGDKPTIGITTLLHQIPYIRENFESDPVQLFQKDSTLIDHKDWARIAREAYRASSKGNKVLILHGTDTLAYTSSALSFAIQNPQTSIVLTGSMRMPEDPETDVKKNLLDAAIFLSEQTKGVFVVFNGKVMAASRITKVSSTDINAHERLSIVDVEHGAQPLIDDKTGSVLAVNGEIYNHKLLKKALTKEHIWTFYLII